MKKLSIWIILLTIMGGSRVSAQRPVGDTLDYGDGDYLYDSIQCDGAYHFVNGLTVTGTAWGVYQWAGLDNMYSSYRGYLYDLLLAEGLTDDEIRHLYPYLATPDGSPHITGQQFYPSEDLCVKGLAFCPIIRTDVEHLSGYFVSDGSGGLNIEVRLPAIDTTLSGRLTEYVQLYAMDTCIRLLAEGGWRIEDPHRYMRFPSQWVHLFDSISGGSFVIVDSAVYAPLYEVMFDSCVVIEGGKGDSYMLAGTHNNNGVVWYDYYMNGDSILCYEHYLTNYTAWVRSSREPIHRPWWTKIDGRPWYKVSEYANSAFNIYPILDTLWGTPCAVTTGLQTVEVDSEWATVMWSADARQHDWQVKYSPVSMPDSVTTVTVSVPTVTLTGLMPRTEYGVTVRGRCDIDNYSPWSDTLLFTTPQDTAQIIDTTTTDTTQTQGIQRMGNLDLFTQIMPNPASEVVNVLSSYRLESVAVYDLTGRLVLEQPAEGITAVVNVSALPHGTYIMAIRTQQGVATKKLVVE